MTNFPENLEKRITPEEERKSSEELADEAYKQGIETVRMALKKEQENSSDDFFKQLNMDELKPEALMILKESIDKDGHPFSKEILENVYQVVKDNYENLYDPVIFDNSPERLRLIKELIVHQPEIFLRHNKKEQKT